MLTFGTQASPERRVPLTAEDGTPLSGLLYAMPGDLGFVVGPGFTHHVDQPGVRRVLRRFAGYGPTLGVDFRGHGRSGGRTTVGNAEVQDLAAGLDHLRGLGCRRVVSVGFSLGAAVAIRQAGLAPSARRPDAVVAVSSPVRWWARETAAMRRVHWMLEQPHGRWSARLFGVRLGPPWAEVPSSPIEVAGLLPPTPLLVVHGEVDHYFPVSEATALAETGRGHLWVEPGMRHAEGATTPELVDRIVTWTADRVTSGTDEAYRERGTAR